MRRREFITLLGSAAAAWPMAARAQQAAMPVIGYLDTASADGGAPFVAALHKSLREFGYVEGKNLLIEYRSADDHADRLPAMAADLVRRPMTVIAARGNAAARAAKSATETIPIVFVVGDDPVKIGLVASLSRPGGNLTGITPLNLELGPKRLELLHELVPSASGIALLINQTNPNAATLLSDAQTAARTLGLHIHILHASTEREFDAAFASLAQLRAGGTRDRP